MPIAFSESRLLIQPEFNLFTIRPGSGSRRILLLRYIIKILMDRLHGTGWSPEIVFSILQYQVVQIFPEYLLTSDPVKNMNDIYNHFRIICPATIPYSASEDEKERMGRG